MKNYEAICIINPRLTEEKIEAILTRLQKKITDNNGEIVKIDRQGIRKLAFIFSKHKKLKEGFFVVIEYKGFGKTTEALMSLLRLQEEVIRHMVTLKEEFPSELEAGIVPEDILPAEPKSESETREGSISG